MAQSRVDVEALVDRMTLEQRVGQCFVLGMTGSLLTPLLRRRIRSICPAGLRCAFNVRAKTLDHDPFATGEEYAHRVRRPPRGGCKDFVVGLPAPYISNEEFCAVLNECKREALSNGAGVPLHATLDMEGNGSADYCRGGIRIFPHPMGLGRTGDVSLAYDVAWAVARQVTPVGFNWIHSPVLGVNTNPMNPEISTRSYGEDAETVTRFAMEALRGFREGGLIATGKHFPGRGACGEDAHAGLPELTLSRDEMESHLAPFRALVDAGIPCIMTAHTSYPALDPSGRPATLSKPILTGLLKGEMGFEGCVTTDDISMGGIVATREVHEAAVEALNAGADLILLREEGPLVEEVVAGVIEAARRGDVSEERLRDANRRVLAVKHDYGLFESGALCDQSAAGEGIADPRVQAIASDAGRRCVEVLRDDVGLLPVAADTRVLLVEQVNRILADINDMRTHPGLLWEKLFAHGSSVGQVETRMTFTDEDFTRVARRADEAEVLIVTHYHWWRTDSATPFLTRLRSLDKPIIMVTNNPYPLTARPEFPTVVVTFGVGPESMDAVARTVYGATQSHA